MVEIRFHGRGGQGAVTSAELTALAAIGEGKFAQAFPSFGPERRGAPVMAFVRVSDTPIRTREKVYEPNIVIVLDPTILKIVNVEAGLKEGGIVILNTTKTAEEVRKETGIKARLALVDASKIAVETMRVPITNTTMLGALLKATGLISMDGLRGPIEHRFGPIAEKNIKACTRAFEETVVEG
ncbi:pyruvate ferredoxin oxidoreductase subunit gamma [Desulforhabdus amnigena]|jgi:pyruvate ferredoxin oxidoreductase gamma subunit|uniref:Pyruvate/ketoisovalerate ferredoxin oxidoreductase subunit gamma n=1 Tax=Desulforhabdus amnigena TaxID=40218 RepID=A0A9W6FUW3_9BACT|nr:pyruvate ferredoxin oxidoreductase subunit gamma [Desulforhabdus amnigena]NLJ29703.1 pyruvate ferredoxin oxidoreductase subunit gamma [Deltaproteobacteria bacterium]GLI35345.1 pyruvate/ketoisovalerate ferredoxin oxidoreductase subunit gamma [Desulforhabdus amnigena]